MSIYNYLNKDPDAILDYELDWSNVLIQGSEIISSTWTVPSGITKNSDSFGSMLTTIWLSGGSVDRHYELVNRITTNNGRTYDKTLLIRCKEE